MIAMISIDGKLEKLKEYVQYLKGYQQRSVQDIKNDPTLRGALLYYLQISIECVIDIGEILISQRRFERPKDSREIFKILAKHEIIPEDFAPCLGKMTGFRNILVHDYTNVNLDLVHQHLQNDIDNFDLYAQHIACFLSKNTE